MSTGGAICLNLFKLSEGLIRNDRVFFFSFWNNNTAKPISRFQFERVAGKHYLTLTFDMILLNLIFLTFLILKLMTDYHSGFGSFLIAKFS